MISFFNRKSEQGKGDEIEMITIDDVLSTSELFFNDIDFNEIFDCYKEDLGGVNWEDLGISQVSLLEIEEDTISGFSESWEVLETIEDQRHYLRLIVVQCVEKYLWNKSYFLVGNKNIREKVFREIQNSNNELEYITQDEYEKDLYVKLVGFSVNYLIALNLLREHLNDGREEDYPARLIYEYTGYVDAEFKRLLARSEKNENKVGFYRNELEVWRKAVDVQRGLVLSFWDVTLEAMFEKGYDTNMVCDN